MARITQRQIMGTGLSAGVGFIDHQIEKSDVKAGKSKAFAGTRDWVRAGALLAGYGGYVMNVLPELALDLANAGATLFGRTVSQYMDQSAAGAARSRSYSAVADAEAHMRGMAPALEVEEEIPHLG